MLGTNKRIENSGSKILAIEGNGNQENLEFLASLEDENEGLKLKYYTWLSRLFIFFATISCLFMVFAALVLFRLAPQVSVEPFLIINQDSSNGIVRQEPITTKMASKEQLMETFIRQYILLRNTVINDETEMQSRWYPGGMVNFLSAPWVFDEFYRNLELLLTQYHSQGLSREVEIISIYKLGGQKSPVWKVDFKTYDLFEPADGSEPVYKERFWTASVTSYFYRDRIFMGRRLINPIGFTVTRFSQTEVEII